MIICLTLRQPSGFMEYSIAYQDITEAHVMARWDAGQHFCFRVAVPDGSLLFKVSRLDSYQASACFYTCYAKSLVVFLEI